jgi:hypothetical protein
MMEMIAIPGYADLFGLPTQTYEELLSNVPSEAIIKILSTINSELNAPIEFEENQLRLFRFLSNRFDEQMRKQWIEGFARFKLKTKEQFPFAVFGRQYLLSMIVKEKSRIY